MPNITHSRYTSDRYFLGTFTRQLTQPNNKISARLPENYCGRSLFLATQASGKKVNENFRKCFFDA